MYCYAIHYLSFTCLLSLQFQGECENILNEFQIYFETHFWLLETLLDRNKLTVNFLVKTNSRSEYYKSNINTLSNCDHNLLLLKASNICSAFYSYHATEILNIMDQALLGKVQEWPYLYGEI